MPARHLTLLILAVILAAGVTVWLLSLAGPWVLIAALPAFLIAAVALRMLNR